jgi:hypothetical protein
MQKCLIPLLVSEDSILYQYLEKYYCIVPSFFKIHNYLDDLKHQKRLIRDFKIVFRTFGVDHQAVFDEFSQFLIGEHPIFSNDHSIETLN